MHGYADALPPLAAEEEAPHCSPLLLVVVIPLQNNGVGQRQLPTMVAAVTKRATKHRVKTCYRVVMKAG